MASISQTPKTPAYRLAPATEKGQPDWPARLAGRRTSLFQAIPFQYRLAFRQRDRLQQHPPTPSVIQFRIRQENHNWVRCSMARSLSKFRSNSLWNLNAGSTTSDRMRLPLLGPSQSGTEPYSPKFASRRCETLL